MQNHYSLSNNILYITKMTVISDNRPKFSFYFKAADTCTVRKFSTSRSWRHHLGFPVIYLIKLASEA